MAHASTRIVMIEDHGMVAAALGGVIDAQDDLQLAAIASTLAEALDAVRHHQPDLVVTDLQLADDDMALHFDELRAACPSSRVLVVTGVPTEKALIDALEAGVRGFIVKSQPVDELLSAVRRVVRGEVVVAPELSSVLMARLDGGRSDCRATLTRRELDVLGLLAEGLGTTEIAERLILSPNTVRNHVAAVMAKLDTHSRLEAVAEASRQGIIGTHRRA